MAKKPFPNFPEMLAQNFRKGFEILTDSLQFVCHTAISVFGWIFMVMPQGREVGFYPH